MFNDGDNTSVAKNLIFSNQFDIDVNPEDLIEFIVNLSSDPLFSNGIKEICSTHGFEGDTEDSAAIKKFVVSRAQERKIIQDAKDVNTFTENLRLWLKSGVIKKDSPQSRINIYKFCFALDMNIAEIEEFFLKKYLYRPFNLRNIRETVYYFAINNSRDYLYAEELIERVCKIISPTSKNNEEDIMTCDFRVDLEAINEEDEFIEYCKLNSSYFNNYNTTAVKNVNYYIDDNLHLLGCNEISVLLKTIYSDGKRDVTSNNEFLKQIKKKVPQKISSSMPSEIEISKIRKYREKEVLKVDNENNDNPSKYEEKIGSDVIRKTLILMTFYNYFLNSDDSGDVEENYEGFLSEVNYVLDLSGYIQCYARNPYDWIFLYSAKQPDPIEIFQAILTEFINLPNNN